MSPEVLAAVIMTAGSIVVAVFNHRATLKRERLARRAQQGGQAGNVLALALLVLAAVFFYRVLTTDKEAKATGSSAPADVAATCPNRAEFEAAKAVNPAFEFDGLPPDEARFSLIVQMIVTSQTSSTRVVASVCQDSSSSSYWYFGRLEKSPWMGVFAPALRTDLGFEAVSPSDKNVQFIVQFSGGIVKVSGKATELPRSEVRCVEPADMPPALVGLEGPRCIDSNAIAWNP